MTLIELKKTRTLLRNFELIMVASNMELSVKFKFYARKLTTD